MQIVNVHPVVHGGGAAEFIGRAISETFATGHPDSEPVMIVVTAFLAFATAELPPQMTSVSSSRVSNPLARQCPDRIRGRGERGRP